MSFSLVCSTYKLAQARIWVIDNISILTFLSKITVFVLSAAQCGGWVRDQPLHCRVVVKGSRQVLRLSPQELLFSGPYGGSTACVSISPPTSLILSLKITHWHIPLAWSSTYLITTAFPVMRNIRNLPTVSSDMIMTLAPISTPAWSL